MGGPPLQVRRGFEDPHAWVRCTTSTCGPDGAYPVDSPSAQLGWRGGRDLDLTVSIAAGIAGLEMWSMGFIPHFEALGRFGVRASVAQPHVVGIVGGTLYKDLSPTLGLHAPTPGADRPGATVIGVRLDADLSAAPGQISEPTFGAGVQACTGVSEYD